MANITPKRAGSPMPYNSSIRVDDEPIQNSEALPTSGGVYKAIRDAINQSGWNPIKGIDFDFSHWDSGLFTETVDGVVVYHYSILFDSLGRPIKFTDSDGNESNITW